MRPLIRLVTSVALAQFAALTAHGTEAPPITPPAAQPATLESFIPPVPVPGDLDHLPSIFKAYRDNDATEAQILKTKLSQPAAQALVEWFAIRSGFTTGLDRILAFQKDYPDWPVSSQFRRRSEDALLAERRPPAQVRAFFAKQPPGTAAGRIALAFALQADGFAQEANDRIRHVWREDNFGPDMERRILDRFPDVLAKSDHRFRMERLLLKENWGGAQRVASYAGKDYELLAKARLSVFQGKKKAEKAFAAVPSSLRSDPSYLFSRALLQRRSNNLEEAAGIIMQAPRDPELRVDGDEWWAEQRLIARALLDKGNPKLAYDVASHHAAESPVQQIEAEFHAGWIALRFLNDPATASKHFATVAQTASTPISISRVAYWQGRAAEAAGQGQDARIFYERASDQPTTYYGQLAKAKLGQAIALRKVDPLSEDERKAFDALVPVQAVKLLQQIGEPDLALSLYTDLAQSLSDPGQLDALAGLATAQQNPRAVLAIGKTALQRGFPLDQHAYPLAAIPDFQPVGDEVEPAMVYAIARQESAFNPRAVSSAGARGLMQLMPATAKRTAQRFGVGFDLNRLTDDPSYNAKIGSAHLGELMEDWKGSYILAFASYNAGGGNVIKWVRTYGDPRKPDVDEVDWVERIPFYETRNYVQRVLENLRVYRQRLNDRAAPPAPATADATSIN
ncbi:lytic transglycosylase domain-containing protein [Microvirga lotononidis]|uniref:Soluble lytic murein transglycosylase-like protein n=1 Tax=Microvirga lotononidis TaxID=864069 RepID=I4YWG1_9HYPH|nr:lytic transglycosylase domain-containing protein [Microvirga lotononidis]EIM28303.1 soluble lytic murein transglycosylase-like protein [Microvirga lotononidis]WQO27604.1 lytic transglycosylase domain-containing protein [Microvirga lotononidis]